AYIEDAAERLRQVWELFQQMEPKQVVNDETLFRELKERFGSPYGWGEYFRGGKGQKQQRAVKRLKVVSAFLKTDNGKPVNTPDMMILEAVPVIPPELR